AVMARGGWGRRFVFQAEDGIRDLHVTGVQTCALPIWAETEAGDLASIESNANGEVSFWQLNTSTPPLDDVRIRRAMALAIDRDRSEERRVGKEASPRRAPDRGGGTPDETAERERARAG